MKHNYVDNKQWFKLDITRFWTDFKVGTRNNFNIVHNTRVFIISIHPNTVTTDTCITDIFICLYIYNTTATVRGAIQIPHCDCDCVNNIKLRLVYNSCLHATHIYYSRLHTTAVLKLFTLFNSAVRLLCEVTTTIITTAAIKLHILIHYT